MVQYLFFVKADALSFLDQIIADLDDLVSEIEVAVNKPEEARNNPTNDLSVLRVELYKLFSALQIKYLDDPLLIGLSLRLFVESYEHLGFLVESIGLDLAIRHQFLMEVALHFEVTEHDLHLLEAEHMFLVIFSEKKLVFTYKMQLLRIGITLLLEGSAPNPMIQFALMQEEYDKFEVFLLVFFTGLTSHEEVQEWPISHFL